MNAPITPLTIGGRVLGPGYTYAIAEIGPNWAVSADFSRNLAELEALIDSAHSARFDAVKLQCKALDGYYRRENLDRPIDDPRSPFRTRREYVQAREPDAGILGRVARLCASRNLSWSASPWDLASVDLLGNAGATWVKVASACLTDDELLRAVASMNVPIVLSTGMSTTDEVDHAVEVLGTSRLALLYCIASYPADDRDFDLTQIARMRERYRLPIGFSSHARGPLMCALAAMAGAEIVEAHITLDRMAWGPDHSASLEPEGMRRLVRDVRAATWARQPRERTVLPCEETARARLRR